MTPDRLQRVLDTLNRRQPDLTVITEEIYKTHNLAAIARTCDAFSVQDIQTVWPKSAYRLNTATAAGSESWVTVNTHPDIRTAIEAMKQRGMRVVAAHLSDQAQDYRQYDFTQPTAVLMGAEKEGVSDLAADLVDEHLIIPMYGMVQSLNVSVAASILLNEAARQREQAGLFASRRLDDQRFRQLMFEWCQPSATRLCHQYDLPYPELRDDGEIADPQAFSNLINQQQQR